MPGFDYPAGYTTFVYGFVLLQASAFGGIFTGFSIARDFESWVLAPADARCPGARRHRRRLLACRAVRALFTIS